MNNLTFVNPKHRKHGISAAFGRVGIPLPFCNMKHGYLIGWLLLFALPAMAQNTGANNQRCGFGIVPELKRTSCPGGNDGAIRLLSATPIANLSFRWEGLNLPATTNSAAGLTAGVYRVIVSSLQCADTLSFRIEDPPLIQAPFLDTVICGVGGLINLTRRIEGGNGEFRVNAARSLYGTTVDCTDCDKDEFFVDSTSLLRVEVKDRNGCVATRDVFIELLDSLKTRAEVLDETCTENGTITMRTTGGSGNYLYALNNSTNLQREPVFQRLRGNTDYNIQVIDLKGCRVAERVRVRSTPQFTPATLAVENVTCNGFRDGSIRVETLSDTNITGYTLDSLNAAVQREPDFRGLPPGNYRVFVLEGPDCYVPYPVRISEPPPLTINATVDDPDCPNEPGSAELRAAGGNGGYAYSINGMDFQDRPIFENLPPGNYRMIVQDRRGCQSRDIFTVTAAEAPPLAADVTASCPDEPSGSIVIVEGGKLLYGNYLFSLDSIVWQQSFLFGGLAPGQYTVFVQYPDGCIHKVIAIVPASEAPKVFFRIQHPSCPSAEDGAIVVEIIDGNSDDYEYSMDGATFINRNSFKDLPAGNYDIYLRDSIDCVFTYPFAIEESTAPSLNIDLQPITCFGNQNGVVTIQAQGGVQPFTYALNNGNFSTQNTFDNLGANTYAALARDANGCIYTESFTLTEPPRIEVQFTKVDETCGNANGVLVGFPAGGHAPYRFKWNTGDTSAVLTALKSGSYHLTVTDARDCSVMSMATLENLTGPIVLGDVTNLQCSGSPDGAIQLTVIGGTQPLDYKWSNGLRTPQVYNLTAGVYTVTVTDMHKCANEKTFTLVEPAPMQLSAETGAANGDWFINLMVAGGIPPYSYLWSNGETTEDIFNLVPGVYTVDVTDREGCIETLSVTVGTTSAYEPAWAAQVQVFPNPVQEQLQIVLDLPEWAESRISLFDINGRLAVPPQTLRQKQMPIDLSRLPAGVYLLRIEHNNRFIYRRVVRQ